MAVKIRLRRMGKRNAPCHRIVVADARSPRDGRFIECIGTYDPRGKQETVDLERATYWLSKGAQASETVAAIIKRARAGVSLADKVKDAPTATPEEPVETVEVAEAVEAVEAVEPAPEEPAGE